MRATSATRSSEGAIVAEVRDGSPGDRAGLRGADDQETFNGQRISKGGDVIVAIDGQDVRSADDVVRSVAYRLPGQVVRMTVVRDGRRVALRVKLGERPAAPDTR